MSPTASIFHGLAVGTLLAVIRAFGWSWEANALTLGILAMFIPLLLLAKKTRPPVEADNRPGADRPTPPAPVPRRERELIALAAVMVPLPSAVFLVRRSWVGGIDITASDNQAVVLAMLLIGLASAVLIFLSGLIDWFYVRPLLRGNRGTVCATSFDPRWRGLTRAWLLHRAAGTYGAIAAVTALVTLAANTWVRELDDVVAGAIAAVATIVAGYYVTRLASLLAIAANPPIQIGDVVEIAEEFTVHRPEDLREYFVVDVAVEGVKLLRVDKNGKVVDDVRNPKRTHDRTVDVTDIARLLRRRRPIQDCTPRCQLLTEHCQCAVPWKPPPLPEKLRRRKSQKPRKLRKP